MNKFFFDYPIVILIMQMASTLCAMEIGRLLKLFKLQAYNFQRGKDMFLPSLFYSLASFFCLNSMDGITMPFFPFIQRFYPIGLVILNVYIFRRQRPSLQTLTVVILVCIGSAFASAFELNLDPWGIIGGAASALMLASALALIEKLQEQHGSALDIIYMNSFNCLCVFLVADLIQDEIRDAFMYLVTSITPMLVLCLIFSIIAGVLCHAALIYCITNTNALNAAIVNSCASALQVIVAFSLSIYLFYDLMPDWYNIGGIVLAVAGTIFFFLSDNALLKIASSSNRYMLVEK
ncbi:triose-phosphate transporter family domain-containing protein [Ditylenchus destructor]|nr:triose-phosphate transporter family domain-containing protein [Ditylenchus destructor]